MKRARACVRLSKRACGGVGLGSGYEGMPYLGVLGMGKKTGWAGGVGSEVRERLDLRLTESVFGLDFWR